MRYRKDVMNASANSKVTPVLCPKCLSHDTDYTNRGGGDVVECLCGFRWFEQWYGDDGLARHVVRVEVHGRGY